MNKILAVEDDAAIANLLRQVLSAAGYKTAIVASAEEALLKRRNFEPDLMILDVGLPGMSGMSLCRILREEPATAALPILMLTSRSEESFLLEGFRVGADDYVAKPFPVRLLLARIAALLRRATRTEAPRLVLKSGPIEADLAAQSVTIAGKKVDLYPKEYGLLTLLLEKRNRVLLYSFILESLWGDDRIATRDDVKYLTCRLRKKLGRHGGCIEAVTNQGLKWVEPEDILATTDA